MKRIFILFLVVFCLFSVSSVFAEDVAKTDMPNIVGTWEGLSSLTTDEDGFRKGEETLKFIILDQDGRHFLGKKEWMVKGKQLSEGFSGVISSDGKRFYTAENVDGIIEGDILGSDTIEIYYLESGKTAKVVYTKLTRIGANGY